MTRSKKLEKAFTLSLNSMIIALLDAGVDPLKTGAAMCHFEELGFHMRQLDNRLSRLEKRRSENPAPARRKSAKLYALPGCGPAAEGKPNPAA
jgi:hypothetical protein